MTVVFRVVKTKNYTMMSNQHLKDKRLTLKAKGLMSVMLSLPENWDYTLRGLSGILRPGNRDCFPAGAKDFHHQLDDLIHPIPVIRRDKAVIPDLRPHAVPNHRNIFPPFPEMD